MERKSRTPSTTDPRLKSYARKQLREKVAGLGLPCHICGEDIDYTLKTPHPYAYQLDEIQPRRFGGDPLSISNVSPSHATCNRSRANQFDPRSRQYHGLPLDADDW
jgi:hypothetical protein